ncbi:Dyp-type peroxidase [Corynebacterium heidelbergense]|nr:Dyp-type peroxidase [Corynebacterium heidelbergense]WCZ36643.1 putative deferrochelatase/peroxidase EfeN precursor [Corynebacterium heidelbergense]
MSAQQPHPENRVGGAHPGRPADAPSLQGTPGQGAAVPESAPRISRTSAINRRTMLAGLGLAGAGGALAACSSNASSAEPSGSAAASPSAGGGFTQVSPEEERNAAQKTTVAFDGKHQAGIETPHQRHGLVVAFDLKDRNNVRRDLTRLMRIWTSDARAMTQGRPALADLEPELTGDPRNLTVTVGWSPQLIADANITGRLPGWLPNFRNGLPPFKGDALQPEYSGGDLVLQVCGDDLTAVSHAMRVLSRGAKDYVTVKWTQRGFVDSPQGQTPRNLLGFKDGSIVPRTPEEFDKAVWDQQGGSAMIVRRIRFKLSDWEALDRGGRETVFGRRIDTGAPLTGGGEFDEPDLNAVDSTGIPVIDPHSHVGITAGSGRTILRRPFNYDGMTSRDGDTGLIFICFQNDPAKAFVPLQRRLAQGDRLNQWITHIGSAVFWCPPGTRAEEYWGQGLLS